MKLFRLWKLTVYYYKWSNFRYRKLHVAKWIDIGPFMFRWSSE